MQTFLPYADFAASAAVLDRQRLGKQRVETLQIMQTILKLKLTNTTREVPTGQYFYDEDGTLRPVLKSVPIPEDEWCVAPFEPKGWASHPAAKMWVGHEDQLLGYQAAICREWSEVRGFRDTCLQKTTHLYTAAPDFYEDEMFEREKPWFIGDEEFHLGHQSNLIRKAPEIYRPIFGDDVPDDLEYKWVADV